MEIKNSIQYESPSAEVLFVTVERNILSISGTNLADDTYEEEEA